MSKLTTLAALALIAAVPAVAHANDHGAAPAVAAPAVAEVAVKVEAKEATLKDGTKIVIEGDMVSVVAADGTKTAAPDAVHELADGTKVETKAGKIVPAADAMKGEAVKH